MDKDKYYPLFLKDDSSSQTDRPDNVMLKNKRYIINFNHQDLIDYLFDEEKGEDSVFVDNIKYHTDVVKI